MEFWKMNGAGNDFIILNDMKESIPDERLGYIAKTVCERHLSIGADGMMVVRPAQNGGDYRMLFYNADGTAAEMCGNGARCICRYGYEAGLAGETQHVETASGTVTGVRIDPRQYRVRLNPPTVMEPYWPADVDADTYLCSYVELGSPGLPHGTLAYEGLASADKDELRELGRRLRYNCAFPKGANITFYEQIDQNHLRAVTYERGVEDFTYACGTGAGSAVSALALMGKTAGKAVSVEMPGGTLTIDVEQEDGQIREIYLTGPTNIVCKGAITDEELEA